MTAMPRISFQETCMTLADASEAMTAPGRNRPRLHERTACLQPESSLQAH
jgi:hypothetical protein